MYISKTKNRKNPLYILTWDGKKAEQIYELIYKDSENLRLSRKYDIYMEYIDYKLKTIMN